MATASVTHALSNGTTADATQVDTNFTDLVNFLNNSTLHKDGSVSMTGLLTLSGDPTADSHAVRKRYVDRRLKTSSSNPITGGVFASGATVQTVTITDPGYDIYVDGHVSIVASRSGATSSFTSWVLEAWVDNVVRDKLLVPFSIVFDGVESLSIGVPIRRVLHSTGTNCSVQVKVRRSVGDGSLAISTDANFSHTQVYWAAQ